MPLYSSRFSRSKLICAFLLSAVPIFSAAADDVDPNAALIAEKNRLKAETDLLTAKTGLETARINALNLPKIENKTDLSASGAGQIETTMLASRAVEAAAKGIDTAIKLSPCANATYVVLTGAEKIDLNQPVAFKAQLDNIKSQLSFAIDPTGKAPLGLGAGAIVGIVNAAAGMFGNDTKITPVDLTSIDATMLAQVLAGKLSSSSCPAKTPSGGYGVANLTNSKIANAMQEIFNLRLEAAEKKAGFAEKPTAPELVAQIVALDSAIKAHDDFAKAATTSDANGAMPLVTAAILDDLAPDKTKIVRVWVNKAGGSLINTKNIATMFGLDPVKVSGGLVVSYSVVNAQTGAVEGGGLKTCQTSLASLRKIQSGKWAVNTKDGPKEIGEAFCR
jgi:hypothetical protein